GSPSLTLKRDDGSYFNVVSYTEDTKPLIGKRVKVWSAETCLFLHLGCYQIVSQIQHEDRLVLDYENSVRMSRGKGNAGLFFYALPGFFILVAIGVLDETRHKVRKIRKLFEWDEGR
ncbi:MAG: hypothetical protein R8K53_08845, partial [Mariprofundaceae bacterium]